MDKAYADIGELLTYTVVINNDNDFPVTNVQFTDPTPPGTSYIGNLLVSAPYTGIDPASGLVITSIPAGGSATISWQVRVNTVPPIPTPVVNVADIIIPDGNSGMSNMVATNIRTAYVTINKMVDKAFAQPGEVLTYTLTLNNAGNVAANNVTITDALPADVTLVPGSLVVSVPATGDPTTAISLTNPVAVGQTVSISFQVTVAAMPNPNPILNKASATFTYTVNPDIPDGQSGNTQSNTVIIPVLRNNLGQPVNDVIETVAREQAALAAIANAEGAKIQRMAAMPEVTPEILLCLNKSVEEMMETIAMLEAVLRQKLSVLNCQIGGDSC